MNYTSIIPTKYKGYTFRSRLEARWAVYFDLIGITWDYEPEGYVLRNGIWYLPDFYLHQLDTFVEIKPFPELYGCENTAYSRLFVSGKDYQRKWFPFSIDHALWVKFGLPNNDADYLLYGGHGKVSDSLLMGSYRCADADMYNKYRNNFMPEKAHYFQPSNDSFLYRDNGKIRFYEYADCDFCRDNDFRNFEDIAKSYKFQRI